MYKSEFDTTVVSERCEDDDTPGDITFFGTSGREASSDSSEEEEEEEEDSSAEEEEEEEEEEEDEKQDDNSSSSSSSDEKTTSTSQDDGDSNSSNDEKSTSTSKDDDDGDDDGDSSSSSDEKTEGDKATTLEEEEATDSDEVVGQNHLDVEETEDIPEEDKIFRIETNSLGGEEEHGCQSVVKVTKVKVEHKDNRDTSTNTDHLFDGEVSLDSYFSVNRFVTSLTMELEEETELHGISLGFFMKAEEEERIQSFEVSVRPYEEEDYTTVISTGESSGAYMDMQYFDFNSRVKAQYVKILSKGNNFNK